MSQAFVQMASFLASHTSSVGNSIHHQMPLFSGESSVCISVDCGLAVILTLLIRECHHAGAGRSGFQTPDLPGKLFSPKQQRNFYAALVRYHRYAANKHP